jgi:hypothetical protein
MTLTRNDLAATVLTGLVVLTLSAAHEGWGVPLVGESRRWAARVILLLGAATCGQGSPSRGGGAKLLAALGIAALVLGVVAIVTASLAVVSLLVVDIVVLWAASTARHARRIPRATLTA